MVPAVEHTVRRPPLKEDRCHPERLSDPFYTAQWAGRAREGFWQAVLERAKPIALGRGR